MPKVLGSTGVAPLVAWGTSVFLAAALGCAPHASRPVPGTIEFECHGDEVRLISVRTNHHLKARRCRVQHLRGTALPGTGLRCE